MIAKLAVRNLVLNSRRSIFMGFLILIGVMAAILGNSFFESAGNGLRRTFSECFTGDCYVSPRGDEPISLFGSDTPIIGSYAPIPVLPFHDRILEVIKRQGGVALTASQISGYALLEYEGARSPIMLFGVDGDEYFKVFPSISITSGRTFGNGAPGMMISKRMAAELERSVGHAVAPGDRIRLSVFWDRGFTIREVPLTGTFEYPAANTVLDRIAYVDADTLRALNGMVRGDAASSQLPEGSTRYLSGDLENVFDTNATAEPAESGVRLQDVEHALTEPRTGDTRLPVQAGSWNFILIRLNPGAAARSFRLDLEKQLAHEDLQARVGDWQAAGGSGAALAGSLRSAFNGGLALVAVVIGLILANSFVIWVNQRTSEIATMRALGASRGFILSLFFAEAAILSMVSGAAGVAVGSAVVVWLGRTGVHIDNRILTLVFGGTTLRPMLTWRTVTGGFLGALAVGLLALLLPLRLALRLRPARVMELE
jgi:putative ABC transport system permease protein